MAKEEGTPEHPARALSEAERQDYVTIVASMAYADKVVYDTELTRLRALARALDLSEEKTAALAEMFDQHAPEARRIGELLDRFKSRPALAQSLVTDAILIAFADGEVAASEARALSDISNRLGVTTAQVTLLGRYVSTVIGGDQHSPPLGRALADELGKVHADGRSPSGIRWLYARLRGTPKPATLADVPDGPDEPVDHDEE